MSKIDLILRNTIETITRPELEKLLRSRKKPSVYIGAAPTGKVHIGYYIQAAKLKDFIDAGLEVKYLLADIHAYLDDRKSPWNLTNARSKYYEEAMTAILKSIGANTKKVKFITGSSFQQKRNYIFDLYKIMGLIKLKRAMRASSEVVRQVENPDLGSLNYALMQSIDVHHLGADIAYSGIDQRKIYMLAREEVTKLGHKKPICIFTPLVGLNKNGGKMSSSESHSAIYIDDSPTVVAKKIKKAYCPEGIIEGNGVIDMVRHVVFPVDGKITIVRPKKFGGNKLYLDLNSLEKDFKAKKIHPADLKSSLATAFNGYLEIVHKHFKNKKSIINAAYPK
jgi:tyrosyl-tRNA synthetase